jgi:anti-anti-sigma factor
MKKLSQVALNGDGTVVLSGVLTFTTVMAVKKEFMNAARDLKQVNIDLSSVSHIDSAALVLLLDFMRYGKATGREITFSSPPESLISLVKVSYLDSIVRFVS